MSTANAYRPPSGFSAFPPVVKNLLIVNGLVFLAQIVFQLRSGVDLPATGPMDPLGVIQQAFSLWPLGTPGQVQVGAEVVAWPQFYPWQLVTSAFLHADVSHILFNMFGLWMFGAVVERTLGSKRFFWFYLVAVLGASLAQLAVVSAPNLLGAASPSLYPTLGASGGVLGVLAAFGMLYPDEKIFLLFLPIPIPAKWFVLGYAAMDLFGGFGAYASNTAHFAHLGGMITGALLILYWRRQKQLQRTL